MKMKKAISFFLALVLVVSVLGALSACGGENPPADGSASADADEPKNTNSDANGGNDDLNGDADADDEEYDDGTVVIRTIEDLITFKDRVEQGETALNAVLKADLDLSEMYGAGKESWGGIDGFEGLFDGNDHTISGLYISEAESDYAGLFLTIKKGTTIKDLHLTDVYIKSSAKAIGGIAASGYGDIENCSFEGTIIANESVSGETSVVGGIAGLASNVKNCFAKGSITAEALNGSNVGGIVGVSAGNIENCTNYASIISTGENFTGSVGGVVGANRAQVISCTNTAAIESTAKGTGGIVGFTSSMGKNMEIIDCFNSGEVTGLFCTGGIIGSGRELLINRCGNTGSVSGMYYTGGIAGCTDGSRVYIENCFNKGDIIAQEWGGKFSKNYKLTLISYATQVTGGVVGEGVLTDIINCYNVGTIVNTNTANDLYQARIGGLVADIAVSEKNHIINCYTAGEYILAENSPIKMSPFGVYSNIHAYQIIDLEHNFCMDNVATYTDDTKGYVFSSSLVGSSISIDITRPQEQFLNGTILNALQEIATLDDLETLEYPYDGYNEGYDRSNPYTRTENLEELSSWVQGAQYPVFDWE